MSFQLPTPPSSTSSGSRSRVQNSSEEGSDLVIFANTATRSYTAERFRLGIPALQILPLLSLPLPSNSPVVQRINVIEPRIEEILETRSINSEDREVVYRTLPGQTPSEDDITYLVRAVWRGDEDAQGWYSAAEEIRALFITHYATRPVKVELLSWQLETQRRIAIVEAEHPLVPAWTSTINPRLHQIINKSPKLKDGWKTIDVLRIGFSSEEYQPMPVTISVTVDWALNRHDWDSAEREIKAFVDACGFNDVQVEFERGNVDSTIFPLQPPTRPAKDNHEYRREDYLMQVPMGTSFGVERYFTSEQNEKTNGPEATIGGYLEILQSNGSWAKYAFTNYHCIRGAMPGFSVVRNTIGELEPVKAPQNSVLQKVDKHGCGPRYKGLQQAYTFESPSRRLHNFSLQFHDKEIKEAERVRERWPGNPDIEQAITGHHKAKARKIAFFDEDHHRFGKLFLASGFSCRTADNGRLDVALLEVDPGRMGNNVVPPPSAWTSNSFQPPFVACGKMLAGLDSPSEGAALGRVFKIGARTGATTGNFSHIKSQVKMGWDKEYNLPVSTEFCFIADPVTLAQPFMCQGDSGSWLFTQAGKWAGTGFGGPVKAGVAAQAIGYVTDAQAILDWLKSINFEARLATF
ncbi:MAG: hypothetical protein LQ341_004130 [Variospora aurantia]|nr:MAG: hypothetical protein LQ341_004130 [Variospora aurantia]